MKHKRLTQKDVDEAQLLVEDYCLPTMRWQVCLSADEECLYLRLNDEVYYQDSACEDCYEPMSAAILFTMLIDSLYVLTNLDV